MSTRVCRFDTVLTDHGKREVRSAAGKVAALHRPDLLVVSPLTRALQSAELAFEGIDCPRIVHPLATERLEHSSDVRWLRLGPLRLLSMLDIHGGCRWLQVGRLRTELEQEFPAYDFDLVDNGIWWHSGGSTDPKHIALQDNGVCHACHVSIHSHAAAAAAPAYRVPI